MSAAESMMVRAVLVTATSLALTGAVVAHAYLLKHQFYPTVVYLTKSSPSMAVRPAQNTSQILNVFFFRETFFSHRYWDRRPEHLPCVFPVLSGVVHSGLCVGVPPWEVHEEGLFWTAEGCRNGGTLLSVFLVHFPSLNELLPDPFLPLFNTASISLSAPGMR